MRLRPALWAQGFGILVGNLVRNPCAAPLCGDLVQSLVPATLRAKFSESQSDRYKKRLVQCLMRALCGPCASLFLPFCPLPPPRFLPPPPSLAQLRARPCSAQGCLRVDGALCGERFPGRPSAEKSLCALVRFLRFANGALCTLCAFFRWVLFSVQHSNTNTNTKILNTQY